MKCLILLDTKDAVSKVIGKLELKTGEVYEIVHGIGSLAQLAAVQLIDPNLLARMQDEAIKDWTLDEFAAIKSILARNSLQVIVSDLNDRSKPDQPVRILFVKTTNSIFDDSILISAVPTPTSFLDAIGELDLSDFYDQKFSDNYITNLLNLANEFYKTYGFCSSKYQFQLSQMLTGLGFSTYLLNE